MSVRKNEQGQYILKVGDVEKTFSEDELFQMAQKGFGAEYKFENAASMLKEAESASERAIQKFRGEVQNLLVQANQGDARAYEGVLDLMGVSGDAKYQQLQTFLELQKDPEEGEEETPAPRGKEKPVQFEIPEPVRKAASLVEKLVARGLTEDDAVDAILEAREMGRKNTKDRVYDEMVAELDKDPVLGRIIKQGGPRAEYIREEAKLRLRGRIRDESKYAPEQRLAVVKDLKRQLEVLGTQPTPIPGLGTADGISHIASQATEAPTPLPSTDGKYDENITQRLAHLVASA